MNTQPCWLETIDLTKDLTNNWGNTMSYEQNPVIIILEIVLTKVPLYDKTFEGETFAVIANHWNFPVYMS